MGNLTGAPVLPNSVQLLFTVLAPDMVMVSAKISVQSLPTLPPEYTSGVVGKYSAPVKIALDVPETGIAPSLQLCQYGKCVVLQLSA